MYKRQLERERRAFAFSMARVKLKPGETKHVKMRARGKIPKDGRIMCVMPSDREERFIVGRTLLDPAKENLFLPVLNLSHRSIVLKKGKLLGSVFLESEDPDRMVTPTCEQVNAAFETLDGPHAENALDLDSTRPPIGHLKDCLLYTSPSPRDATLSRMPSSA